MGSPNRPDVILGSSVIPAGKLTPSEQATTLKGMLNRLQPLMDILPGFSPISTIIQQSQTFGGQCKRHTKKNALVLGCGLKTNTQLLELKHIGSVEEEADGRSHPHRRTERSLWLSRRGELVGWNATYRVTHKFRPHARGAWHDQHEEAERSSFVVVSDRQLLKLAEDGVLDFSLILMTLDLSVEHAATRREQHLAQIHAAAAWLKDVRNRLGLGLT